MEPDEDELIAIARSGHERQQPEQLPMAGPMSRIPSLRRPRSWELREQHEQEAEVRLASVLNQMSAAIGGLQKELMAAPNGGVLLTTSATMGQNGFQSWDWKTNYSSIAIANLSANELVLSSATPTADGRVPGRSTGAVWIPAGYFRVVGLHANVLTIYGAQGSNFDFTAYVRPQAPNFAACGNG
jgi:hypothetical protein